MSTSASNVGRIRHRRSWTKPQRLGFTKEEKERITRRANVIPLREQIRNAAASAVQQRAVSQQQRAPLSVEEVAAMREELEIVRPYVPEEIASLMGRDVEFGGANAD